MGCAVVLIPRHYHVFPLPFVLALLLLLALACFLVSRASSQTLSANWVLTAAALSTLGLVIARVVIFSHTGV